MIETGENDYKERMEEEEMNAERKQIKGFDFNPKYLFTFIQAHMEAK